MMDGHGSVSRRAILGLGGLALGTGLVGCSAGSGDDETDSGWVSVQSGHITVRHPKEWVEKTSPDEEFTKWYTDGDHSMFIAGEFTMNSKTPILTDPVLAYGKLDMTVGGGEVDGYHSKGYQEITIKGAPQAIKCPYVFTRKGRRNYGWWLIASGAPPMGRTGVVSLNLPTNDSSLVDKIASTMEFHQ
ncbi:Tat pathway signal sequence [Cutibacterium granulosum]|uniref:Tat pathway signal sequence n=1 Tax=Cutibacterium granulosum TaxID=33011 RepID=UPI00396A8D5C